MIQSVTALVGSLSDTKLPFVRIRAGMFECIPADSGTVSPPRKGNTVRRGTDDG